MSFFILIVEDDLETANMIKNMIHLDGYDIDISSTIEGAKRKVGEKKFDLILLDVNLTEFSSGKSADFTTLVGNNLIGQEGFELAAWLHANHKQIRVIFLTSRNSISDRVRSLDIGGDDFISKPFSFEELRARIRSSLRRSERHEDQLIFFNGWQLNVTQRQISRLNRQDIKAINLTNVECNVLFELLKAGGSTISRESLSKRALGRPLTPHDRAVDTSISKLRSKMNDEIGSVDRIIETMHGLGYRLIRR